jgi:galactokinase
VYLIRIGEHTDYNEGYVFPMCIEQETYCVARFNGLKQFRIVSININQSSANNNSSDDNKSTSPSASSKRKRENNDNSIQFFDSQSITLLPTDYHDWTNYFRGCITIYAQHLFNATGRNIDFFDCCIGGNVPLGGGLSSSASLCVAIMTMLDSLCNLSTPPTARALLCQQVEWKFANMPCGIMDQFISACGHINSAMLLDCKTQQFELIPFTDSNLAFLITNSHVSHSFSCGTESEYAVRRKQCNWAVEKLKTKYDDIHSLRDANINQLESIRSLFNERSIAADDPNSILVFNRARHVITENARVIAAAKAAQSADYRAFGHLMIQSHVSLKNDYEVSCAEIDCLVNTALLNKAVYGSRITGGGFGGCTVTLCEAAAVEEIKQLISTTYNDKMNRQCSFLISRPAAGSSIVHL